MLRMAGRRGEPRWPMLAAVLVAGVLNQLMPANFRLSPHWVFPVVMGSFLIVLVVGDPGRIDRERRWLQMTTRLLIGLLTLGTILSATRLVADILTHGAFDTAGQLLGIGAIVWLSNVIAFALWFWDLDGGGAATRLRRGPMGDPAFVFPEMTQPDLVPPTWFPQFADYLALSFATATTFGPADVSAIKRWAKMMMIAESLISLALAALVIARAINIA